MARKKLLNPVVLLLTRLEVNVPTVEHEAPFTPRVVASAEFEAN